VSASGPTRALVIWAMDGRPLAESDGPFRIAVLTDGMPSRSLRQLEKIEVLDAAPATVSPRAVDTP